MIPMLKSSEQITFLCGEIQNVYDIPAPFRPFSPDICCFLNELSSLLMKHPQSQDYPDILTFGFFCRKANIEQKKKNYGEAIENRLGRGLTFHIAPSNVPINFAYSMVAALLAGNACIVRTSSKSFPQTEIVCNALNELLGESRYSELRRFITVVKYPHSKEITDYFSAVCDVRIIWGGDHTVEEVRLSPINARAVEITFADRYSLAVFDSEAILRAKPSLAHEFYNDTYLYDQNACSSPRLIYWLGDEDKCSVARDYFWNMVHDYLQNRYQLEPVLTVDKYALACRMAIDRDAVVVSMPDFLISRVEVSKLSPVLQDYRCAGGIFIEYKDTSLDALSLIVTPRVQTVSYYGDLKQRLIEFVLDRRLTGIDRIVPVGRTSDFDFLWDGYDLIEQMSRCVVIK